MVTFVPPALVFFVTRGPTQLYFQYGSLVLPAALAFPFLSHLPLSSLISILYI